MMVLSRTYFELEGYIKTQEIANDKKKSLKSSVSVTKRWEKIYMLTKI